MIEYWKLYYGLGSPREYLILDLCFMEAVFINVFFYYCIRKIFCEKIFLAHCCIQINIYNGRLKIISRSSKTQISDAFWCANKTLGSLLKAMRNLKSEVIRLPCFDRGSSCGRRRCMPLLINNDNIHYFPSLAALRRALLAAAARTVRILVSFVFEFCVLSESRSALTINQHFVLRGWVHDDFRHAAGTAPRASPRGGGIEHAALFF